VVLRATDGSQKVIVTARDGYYSPGNIAVKAGVPTTLVMHSADVTGCTSALVVPSLSRQWILPQNGDTRIDLGVLKPGTLEYTCGKGMYSGQLTMTS
jgi:plastocyanin domain-containing protein